MVMNSTKKSKMLKKGYRSIVKKAAALLMCAAFVFAALPPAAADAADTHNEGKTVRVGWYESSFNTLDEEGRRSGYAYEYQMKIAAYTG